MPERHVVFAGEIPAADQTARAGRNARSRYIARQRASLLRELAAMDKAAQAPPTGEFERPEGEYEKERQLLPKCRWCDEPVAFGVCRKPECARKWSEAKYKLLDEEMERGNA